MKCPGCGSRVFVYVGIHGAQDLLVEVASGKYHDSTRCLAARGAQGGEGVPGCGRSSIADRNSTRIHSQISTSHESASLPSRDAEKAMKFSREAQEWLKSYSGSIDSTALLLAFDAGRSAGRSASRVRKAAREYLDARDALSAALDEGSLSFANAFIDAFQVTRHKLAALRAADAEET